MTRVDLSAVTAITSFADLTADHLSTAGGNAVIIDGANRLFLIGVSAGSPLADDVIFRAPDAGPATAGPARKSCWRRRGFVR